MSLIFELAGVGLVRLTTAFGYVVPSCTSPSHRRGNVILSPRLVPSTSYDVIGQANKVAYF